LLAARAHRHGVSGDFELFWFGAEAAAAREPLYHGTAAWHGGYLYAPIFAIAFRPLVWLPIETALVVWTGASLLALLASAHLLRTTVARWSGRAAPPMIGLVALLILAVPTASNFRWSNSNAFMMLLITAALAAHVARRPVRTGLALSLAAVIKLTPLLFLGWLALRRDGRTLLAFGAGCALWLAVIPAAALGPGYALTETRGWLAAVVFPAAGGTTLRDANGSLPRMFDRIGAHEGSPSHRAGPAEALPDEPARAASGASLIRGTGILLAAALLVLTAMASAREPGPGVLSFCATAAAMLLAAPAARSAQFMQIYPLVGILLACAANGPSPRALLARRGLITAIASMLALYVCARFFGVSSKEFFPVTALAFCLWSTAALLALRSEIDAVVSRSPGRQR
jgi:hypothetical protein